VTDCWLNLALQFPTLLASQETWIRVIETCAGVLFILALLNLIVGWVWRLSWRLRLTALVPFAASIGAGIAALSLQDTYTYWVTFLCDLPRSYPPVFQIEFMHEIANANHTAAVLGWVAVIVMALLLALSLLGIWRLLVSRRVRQQPSASLAIEP
jgi:hypothetical protein